METIIDFVKGNIYLVVVAAVFLMSMLGKSGKRPARMPDFGGGQDAAPPTVSPPQQQQPRVRPNAPRAAGDPAVMTASPQPYSVPQAYREQGFGDREGREGRAGAVDRISASSIRQAKPGQAAKPMPAPGTDIGADELRQAVVWAEILGPPRARSPLGRRK